MIKQQTYSWILLGTFFFSIIYAPFAQTALLVSERADRVRITESLGADVGSKPSFS